MEPFTFITTDGIQIHGITNGVNRATKHVVCLHAMPATKESYLPLFEVFSQRNWQAYAIDFRGHGESDQGGLLDWGQFTNEEHQKYLIDAFELADRIESEHGIDAVIGASVGANVALRLQVEHSIPLSVLLSPGLNYRGLPTLPYAEELRDLQGTYIVTSEDDARVSGAAAQAQQIYAAAATSHKKITVYPGSEHGTDIIESFPDRIDPLVAFLRQDLISLDRN